MAVTYYALAAVLGLILATRLVLARRSPSAPFPGGPPSLPILGHLHQIPPQKAFLTFADWSRTYGASSDGLIGLRLGPSAKILVLNKWQHVRDLLDTRGSIYSSRPTFVVAELVLPPPGSDLHLVMTKYGAVWRRTRKTITDFLSDRGVERLLPVQDAESTQMMWELLTDDSSRHHDNIMRYFAGVILASVYGFRGKDGSVARRFFAVQDEWAKMLDPSAAPPVDIFPWLSYIPDSWTPWKGWRKRAEALRERQSSLYRDLFVEMETRGKARKDGEDVGFLAKLVRDQEQVVKMGTDKHIYSQLELHYIGGFLMEGGADTTAMAFESFVLAMASHPDIQKQAQEEVDRVFGSDRLPHSADGKQLPFLRACFLETLRWRPGFPASIPYANTADDTYRGYFIPKGTTIIANTWALSHDPDVYEDPDEFKPSRYLANKFGAKESSNGDAGDVEGGSEKAGSRKQTYAFGSGRRMCAGQKMAENSMMMTMSKLVWAFNVLPREGEKLDTSMHTAYKDAILTGPKELNVRFLIRDEKKRDIIGQDWEKANAFLSRFE